MFLISQFVVTKSIAWCEMIEEIESTGIIKMIENDKILKLLRRVRQFEWLNELGRINDEST